MTTYAPWWVWLLPILFSAPWIAGIIWFWTRTEDDDAEPPSMGELARHRLWQQ